MTTDKQNEKQTERFAQAEQCDTTKPRVFKSVIALDRNFHIYVHGSPDLIEKGYDPQKGMAYYKIYFEEEK